jgi:hypothetical protein
LKKEAIKFVNFLKYFEFSVDPVSLLQNKKFIVFSFYKIIVHKSYFTAQINNEINFKNERNVKKRPNIVTLKIK